jgi:hypothetical protein
MKPMKHLMRYEGYTSTERVDDILDKISKYGIKSLTQLEKEFLATAPAAPPPLGETIPASPSLPFRFDWGVKQVITISPPQFPDLAKPVPVVIVAAPPNPPHPFTPPKVAFA